jgi:hypothetical protein
MGTKKTLSGIVLASYIAIVSTPGFSQEQKLKFSLSPKHKTSYLSNENSPQMQSFIKMQETFRKNGEDYVIMIAPGGNMPIYTVPRIDKYPVPEIKPDLKLRLPEGWLKKDFYLPGKPSQGLLIYDSNRKRI